MKRKAAVTGGAGFIGSALARKLSENNYQVTVYDDFSSACGKKNLPKNTRIVRGSTLNWNKFREAIKNTDVVFNLAVKPLGMSFDRPDEVVRTNDYGTYLVAKARTEKKCRVVHVSSSEAYGTAKACRWERIICCCQPQSMRVRRPRQNRTSGALKNQKAWRW